MIAIIKQKQYFHFSLKFSCLRLFDKKTELKNQVFHATSMCFVYILPDKVLGFIDLKNDKL